MIVWHQGLIRKMIVCAIDGGIIHLISHYLNNRQFVVKLNNEESDIKPIASGVPQGSILGPTLFNIYINDIPHNREYNNSQLHIFADDTLITGQSHKPEYAANQVQRNLTLLGDWLEKWRVKIIYIL